MLKINPNPTFWAKVKVPVHGGEVCEIEVEFKHKSRPALESFLTGKDAKSRKDEDTILEIAKDWKGVDGEFTRDNLSQLFANYHAAARAIVEAYILELTQARLGN